MKKVVVIGANDFQDQLIQKAKTLGYETHVFAWKDGAPGEKSADVFYPVSIVEKEEILRICQTIQPDAVVSIASDLAMLTVNAVAGELGLPCNSRHCTELSTNKYAMRRAFAAHGIPTPGFVCVGELDDWEAAASALTFPVIVKPTDRSGSRAIFRCETAAELAPAIREALRNSFEKRAMIEDYLDGDEYSCECISSHGMHHFLALTRKFTTGAPHFIETGHRQPAGFSAGQEKQIAEEIFRALDALEITTGASHAEFRLNRNGEVRIIEIGARMGGDCIGSDLVRLSTGCDYVKMVLDTAMGLEPDFTPVCTPSAAQIQFIFTPDDLARLNRVREQAPQAIYRISEIEQPESRAVVDSSTRFGYYIVTCQTTEEAERLRCL